MIPDTNTLSTIAQFIAASTAEEAPNNAARLEAWQRKYPHDVVPVPAISEPPSWPCKRISLEPPAKITRLKVRG